MSDPPPLRHVARVAVDDLRRGREAVIDAQLAGDLVDAIELALLTAVRTERRACVAECVRRAELWERTAGREEAAEPARREGVNRSNEARYLADLLATRS